MTTPRIEFHEQGEQVVMVLVTEAGSNPLSEVNQAAYALAKRGYTKRDLDRHPWPGVFQVVPETRMDRAKRGER